MEDLDTRMTELDIAVEVKEELILDEGFEEENNRFELCLVGIFLTEKNINMRAMKTKLADLWRPAISVSTKVLKPGIMGHGCLMKQCLFQMLFNLGRIR